MTTTDEIELLDRTLAQIEAHPETWEQTTYRCDSGMCFAGWACELAGGRWLTKDPDGLPGGYLLAESGDENDEPWLYSEKLVVGAGLRAQRLLGLTRGEAVDLFDAENTFSDIRRIVREIKVRKAEAG